jgi:anti-sigma factor RsiW
MKCPDIENIIQDYIDGELSQERVQHVREHLASCPHCKSYEEAFRAAIKPLRAAEQLPVPESVWLNIKRAIPPQKEPGYQPWALVLNVLLGERQRTIIALAASILLAIGLLVVSDMLQTNKVVGSYLGEQLKALRHMGSHTNDSADVRNLDFGTNIERFLL